VLSQLVGKSLAESKYAEITGESVLTQQELNHFQNFLFPVHVYGYNWLQDNKTSAEGLVAFIDRTIDLYKNHCGHGMPFPPGRKKSLSSPILWAGWWRATRLRSPVPKTRFWG
jgi:hypothetical protein